jgi:hypothetical protein
MSTIPMSIRVPVFLIISHYLNFTPYTSCNVRFLKIRISLILCSFVCQLLLFYNNLSHIIYYVSVLIKHIINIHITKFINIKNTGEITSEHTMSELPLGRGNPHIIHKWLRCVTFSSYRTLWNENHCPVSNLKHTILAIKRDSDSSGNVFKLQKQRIYMDWTKKRQPGYRNVTNLKSITWRKRTVTYFYRED